MKFMVWIRGYFSARSEPRAHTLIFYKYIDPNYYNNVDPKIIYNITKDSDRIENIYNKLINYLTYDSLVKDKVYIVDWQKDSDILVLDKFVRTANQDGFKIIIYNDFKPVYKYFKFIDYKTDKIRINISNIIFMKQFTIKNFDLDGNIDINNSLFFGKFAFYLNNINGSLFFLKNTFGNIFYLNDNSIEKVILGDIDFTSEDVLKDYGVIINSIKDDKNNKLKHFRQSCNFIKHHYTEQHNYIDSNAFYALEMLAREKELENVISLDDSFNKLVFIINKCTSNHGQSIKKPFFIVLGLAFYWGWIFTDIDAFFSIFIPITDLVKMDIYKEIDKYIWWVKILVKILYTFSKVLAVMLWWQLIRAIRKDIKR